MKRALFGLMAAAVLTVTGCSGSEEPAAVEPEVSAKCNAAMTAAAGEPDPTAAEPLIVATLSECSTTDEWYTSLRQHPGAFGLIDDAVIGRNDQELKSACYGNESTSVCNDAASQGRL